MIMDYEFLRAAPLDLLLLVEGDDTQTPQDRLKAREALYARVGELNASGWLGLGVDARAAMMRLFDRGADDEAEADAAVAAAKKVDRRAA